MHESPMRIEPARLEEASEKVMDLVAELSAASAKLGDRLHPKTAANLTQLVRIMNTYYSNLIEGHNTRPRDVERAMEGNWDQDQKRRNLQAEALAHIRVQAQIEELHLNDQLPEPASEDFIKFLHREFYADAPEEMLLIKSEHAEFLMTPGEWRSAPEHNVAVGRHQPPASDYVAQFMEYFEDRYHFNSMGLGAKILAIPAAHHRFNYIHPFPDGNGRVSRLMSHAMALQAGIGAHGLWSISRGLARGLSSRSDYKSKMDNADTPRRGDLDGRGNLSLAALEDFTLWFLEVCIDQINFMTSLFDLDNLFTRYERLVLLDETLKPEAANLLKEALIRGEIKRGEASRITGLPDRSAQRVLADLLRAGLMSSSTPKGPVSLRFPVDSLELLLPRLFPQT